MEAIVILLIILGIVFLATLHSKVNQIGKDLKKVDSKSNQVIGTLSRLDYELKLGNKVSNSDQSIQKIEKLSQTQPKVVMNSSRKEIRKVPEQKISKTKNRVPITRSPKKRPEVKPLISRVNIESFLGGNVINKIAITILSIGIGLFVKYQAFDNMIFGNAGKVMVGIIGGMALLTIAHRFRLKYAGFSSGLIAGGISILYFTVGIAYHQYGFVSQTMAFVLMVVLTGFLVLLSLGYNRQELAIMSIIGGFVTPFITSGEVHNYHVLFCYIIILNTGLLMLSIFRKWRALTSVCFGFTSLTISLFLVGSTYIEPLSLLVYGTILFLLFYIASIVYEIRNSVKFRFIELSQLLLANSLFFSFGYYLLSLDYNLSQFQGVFTFLIAVLNFVAFKIVRGKKLVDKNFILLVVGIILTFVTLAFPIQVDGNVITLFWSTEAVLLMWLSTKTDVKLVRIASILIGVMSIGSLIRDWLMTFNTENYINHNLIVTSAFITSIWSIICLVAQLKVLKFVKSKFVFMDIQLTDFRIVLKILLASIGFVAGIVELNFQLSLYDFLSSEISIVNTLYISVYMFMLGLVVKTKNASFENISTLFKSMFMPLVLVLVSFLPIKSIRSEFVIQDSIWFILHYLMIGILILCIGQGRKILKNKEWSSYFRGVVMLFSCLVACMELEHLLVLFGEGRFDYHFIINNTHKVVFPIVLGVCGLIAMVIGLKRDIFDLRLMSLVLFAAVLLKLFIVDIWLIPVGGRIAAFISLGVLLLIISFLYQKIKKIILK